jgi:hypothetical protein
VDAQGNVYISDHVNHRIQKFAPGVPGWRQISINAFGNRDNTCVSTFAVFQDTLYAGTTSDGDTSGELWRYDEPGWTMIDTPGFGIAGNQHMRGMTVFDGYLYVGTTNEDSGAEIWRSDDGENWSRVVSGGFDDANNTEINHLAVFSDTLYANTVNHVTGAQVWRSKTGAINTWTQVNQDGFSSTSNANASAWFMTEFDGQLYVGTFNKYGDGGEIWRSSDGSSWEKVTQGFDDSNNRWVHSLVTFGGKIYASTGNWDSGGQVWRSGTGNPNDWTEVVSGGFDDPDDNDVIRLVGVNDDYLYAATANWTSGEEVWRTKDGTDWEQVNTDGFGDSNNYDPFWSNASVVYDGSLYLGTCNAANGGEVWQMLRQVYLPLVLRIR